MRAFLIFMILCVIGFAGSVGIFIANLYIDQTEEEYRNLYPPANAVGKVKKDGSIELTWEIADGKADGFNIYFTESSKLPKNTDIFINYVEREKVRTKKLNIKNLIPLRNYYFWIEGYNTVGKSPKKRVRVVNRYFPLRKINSIKISELNNTSIEIKWEDKNTKHNGYFLQWKDVLDDDKFFTSTQISKSKRSFVINKSKFKHNDSLYVFRMTPYMVHENRTVKGDPQDVYFRISDRKKSREKFFDEYPDEEQLSLNVNVKKIDSENYVISWKPPDLTVHGYKLYQSSFNIKPSKPFSTIPHIDNSVTVNLPFPEQRYFWIEPYRGQKISQPVGIFLWDDHRDNLDASTISITTFKNNYAEGNIQFKGDVDIFKIRVKAGGSYWLENSGVKLDYKLLNNKNEPVSIDNFNNLEKQTVGFRLKSKRNYFLVVSTTEDLSLDEPNSGEYVLKYYRKVGHWREVVKKTFFRPLSGHQAIKVNDTIMLLGGRYKKKLYNEIWTSKDLVYWNQSPDSILIFSPREGHRIIHYKKKYWLIGGRETKGVVGDIWSSTDGVNWKMELASANFAPRWNHTLVVFKNELYLIGGETSKRVRLSDVWKSRDGVNWNLVTTKALFGQLSEHESVVFKNQILIIGGRNNSNRALNTVWTTKDGNVWIKLSDAQFIPRSGHRTIVYNDFIFLVGGINQDNKALRDFWISDNGIRWNKGSRVGFSAHFNGSLIHYKDNFAVIGGMRTKQNNNVWVYEP